MLARQHRISVKQFNLVMEKGRALNSSLFVVRSLAGQDSLRIGAVAPAKVARKASGRTRIRRLIYEAVSPLVTKMRAGNHLIIFAKNKLDSVDFSAISADLAALFAKAGILK